MSPGWRSSSILVRLWRAWRQDTKAAFRWGNPWLEARLGQACPGDLVVVAGRTNEGKSHYALGNIALPMAEANGGRGVLYVSLEDPPHRVGRRMDLCGYGHPNLHCSFPAHNLLSEVEADIGAAGNAGFCCVVVDYLQNLAFDGSESVFNDAGAISRTVTRLKKAAGAAGVVLVLLSQVRRPLGTSDAGPPFPTIFELKGTGDIENKAEFILLLGRSARSAHHVWLELAKGKDCEVGARQKLRRGPDTNGRLVPYEEGAAAPEDNTHAEFN